MTGQAVTDQGVYDSSVYLPRPTAVTPARRAAQQREALDAVRRVRELHRSAPGRNRDWPVCSLDGERWPCATIAALKPTPKRVAS